MKDLAFEIRLTQKNSVFCESLEAARDEFQKFIQVNGFGYSQLSRNAGDIRVEGRKVAAVSYNGRMWTPERYPHCREILPLAQITGETK